MYIASSVYRVGPPHKYNFTNHALDEPYKKLTIKTLLYIFSSLFNSCFYVVTYENGFKKEFSDFLI